MLTFQIACHFSAWLEKPRGFYCEVIFAPDAKKSHSNQKNQYATEFAFQKDISHLFVTYFLDIVKDGQLQKISENLIQI